MNQTLSAQSLPLLEMEESHLNEEKRETLETLRIRKEALEDALNKKLSELKSLCLREGELTGELPPEMPLGPREPVPQIRKRVRTEFTLDDKLLLKGKTEEEEIICSLELEIEIQSKIVKATQKLCNEENIKRNSRKQRKRAYQQALVKLNDLEQKLLSLKKNIDADTLKSRKTKYPSIQLVSDIEHSDDDDLISTSTEASLYHNSMSRMRNDKRMSSSAPSTPVRLRAKTRPISPRMTTSFVPISPPNKRSMKTQQRPNSAFVFTSRDTPSHMIPRCQTTIEQFRRSPEYDEISNYSGHSSNSGHLSLPRRICSPALSDVSTSNNLLVPMTRNSISFTREDIASLTETGQRATTNVTFTAQRNALIRSNSIENSRRKSYIAATQSCQLQLSQQPRQLANRVINGTSPTPVIRNLSAKMAQRPLPPTPLESNELLKKSKSQLSMNNKDVNALGDSNKFSNNVNCGNNNTKNIGTNQTISKVEPSTNIIQAVRSSVVRTPFTTNISTTCPSDNLQNTSTTRSIPSPSPIPSLPPRTQSVVSRASEFSCNSNSSNNSCNFSSNISEASVNSQKKTWTETSIDSPPLQKKTLKSSMERAVQMEVDQCQMQDQAQKHRQQMQRPQSQLIQRSNSYQASRPNSRQTQRPQSQVQQYLYTQQENQAQQHEIIYEQNQQKTTRPNSRQSQRPQSQMQQQHMYTQENHAQHEMIHEQHRQSPRQISRPNSRQSQRSEMQQYLHAQQENQSQQNKIIYNQQQDSQIQQLQQEQIHPQPSYQAIHNEEINLTSQNMETLTRETRRNIGTPRPVSIPLSPTLPTPGAGVEVNILSVGHFQPYWEEIKPYELSDFYKYSAKHRRKQEDDKNKLNSLGNEQSERKPSPIQVLPDKAQASSASNDLKENGEDTDESETNVQNTSLFGESFLVKSTVSDSFQNEMYEWYEEKVKKATLV